MIEILIIPSRDKIFFNLFAIVYNSFFTKLITNILQIKKREKIVFILNTFQKTKVE